MHSWNLKVLFCAACVCGATACSDGDQSTTGAALTPAGGAAGASGTASRGGSAGAAGSNVSGGSNAGGSNAGGSAGSNAGASNADASNAGASGADAASAGAGAAGAADVAGAAGAAGAGADPGLPDAGAEPPEEEPPPEEDVVGFSDVYGLLVANCAGCHSGNPAYLPPFAQPDEEAASALVQPGGLADRIYARAVIDRTMPPACDEGDFGDPGCVSEEEAALLRAWADGGYQP